MKSELELKLIHVANNVKQYRSHLRIVSKFQPKENKIK